MLAVEATTVSQHVPDLWRPSPEAHLALGVAVCCSR
jgi:hypothetical protein